MGKPDSNKSSFFSFDLDIPPCEWRAGQYPAMDDIKSWIHLVVIFEKTVLPPRPVIPDCVYVFKISDLSEIIQARYIHSEEQFFRIYGRMDIFEIAHNEWLQTLVTAAKHNGIEYVKNLFPPCSRYFITRRHPNPDIQKLIDAVHKDRPMSSRSALHQPEKQQINRSTTRPTRQEQAPPFDQIDFTLVEDRRRGNFSFQGNQDGYGHAAYPNEPQNNHHANPPHQKHTNQIHRHVNPRHASPQPNAGQVYCFAPGYSGTQFSFVDSSAGIHPSQTGSLPGETDSTPMGSGISCGIVGRGGMATVYKVRNPVLEVTRAGKVLELWKFCENEQQVQQFISRYEIEAKISAQLHHPNIVQVHMCGQFMGQPYLEMEYVEGMDLGKLIARQKALPFELVTALGLLCARGIAHAHSQDYTIYGKTYSSIMHRDIKPANILVSTTRGDVKVTDFGIARPPSISSNTLANDIVGTLGYMSPEQMRSRDLDTRTDVYSLGAVIYEMITGVKLFPQATVMELIRARQANSFIPMGDLRNRIPKRLLTIVNHSLKPNLRSRIQSVDTIVDCLEDAHAGLTREKPETILQEYLLGSKSAIKDKGLKNSGLLTRLLSRFKS